MIESIQTQVKQIAERLLEEEGYELVDLVIKGGTNNRLVQIFADKFGGLTVEDCTFLNRKLLDLLDRGNVIDGGYRLEVSSPGLNRPLKTEKDFRKNIGKEVAIDYRNQDRAQHTEGTILDVDGIRILLKTNRETAVVPVASVIKTKIKLKW